MIAGHVVGSEGKKASPNKLQSLQASVNVTDKWARVYLARLCSAILYAERTSTQEFAKGQGKPFWTMLVLLVTRCRAITQYSSLHHSMLTHILMTTTAGPRTCPSIYRCW